MAYIQGLLLSLLFLVVASPLPVTAQSNDRFFLTTRQPDVNTIPSRSRDKDPDQIKLLHECRSTNTSATLPPLPVCTWCIAFTCCSNYPSSGNWAKGFQSLNDPTYARELLNRSAVYVATTFVSRFVMQFKQLPPSFRVTLVSGGDIRSQPLQILPRWGPVVPKLSSLGNDPRMKQHQAIMAKLQTPATVVPDLRDFLSDPRLHRWYVQNYDLIGCRRVSTSDTETCSDVKAGVNGWTQEMIDKVRPIPLGLDFHSSAGKLGLGSSLSSYCSQRHRLHSIWSKIPSFKSRPPTSVYAFRSGPVLARRPWPGRLKFLKLLEANHPNGSMDFVGPKTDQTSFWESLANHSFSISPTGAGMDCHRMWEILALKTVPIVQKTSLSPLLYEGLPIIVVDKWEEVFEPGALVNFKRQIVEKFGEEPFDRPDVTEKLTTEYWVNKIQSDLAQIS